MKRYPAQARHLVDVRNRRRGAGCRSENFSPRSTPNTRKVRFVLTANEFAANVILEFDKAGFSVTPVGRFFLTPNEDQTLNIEFK